MPTRQEFEGDYGDANVGSKGRIMAQGLRKMNPLLLPTNTAVIFINQLTANVGAYSPMGAPPDITTGGKALKFYASLRIEVNRIGAVKAGENIIGAQTKAKVIKNKTFAPYKEATFDIIYGRGVSRGSSIIDKAVEMGAIKKSGAWYTDPEGESLGQGKPAAIDLLDTNNEVYARILSAVEGK
jgi:recombination protein RecA